MEGRGGCRGSGHMSVSDVSMERSPHGFLHRTDPVTGEVVVLVPPRWRWSYLAGLAFGTLSFCFGAGIITYGMLRGVVQHHAIAWPAIPFWLMFLAGAIFCGHSVLVVLFQRTTCTVSGDRLGVEIRSPLRCRRHTFKRDPETRVEVGPDRLILKVHVKGREERAPTGVQIVCSERTLLFAEQLQGEPAVALRDMLRTCWYIPGR